MNIKRRVKKMESLAPDDGGGIIIIPIPNREVTEEEKRNITEEFFKHNPDKERVKNKLIIYADKDDMKL